MPKFVQQSRYHLDDKDLSDLLSSPWIGERFLLKFAKRKGMVLSDDETRESTVEYLSRQIFSWQDISLLAEELNQADRDDKTSTCQIDHSQSDINLSEVLQTVKNDRNQKHQEVYQIKKLSSGSYDVTVTYTEIDPYLSRPFQKKEKNVVLAIDPKKGLLEVQHSSNDRASQIVASIAKAIELLSKKQVTTRVIELADIHDTDLRSQFFLEITSKVTGFRMLDVKDLKVDHRLPEITSTAEGTIDPAGEAAEKNEAAVETLQAIVRQAAFTGQNLVDSQIYQELRNEGYFICSINWLARELDGEDRNVEFFAEFGDTVNFRGFRFDVRKIGAAAKDKDTKITLTDLRRRYLGRLEEASYAAMSSIQKKAKESTKGVA